MKQLILMIAISLVGTVGAVYVSPFYGVAVYYLLAVLRPNYIWGWALPEYGWSFNVGIASICATLGHYLGIFSFPSLKNSRPSLTFTHYAVLVFGMWISLTYFTAHSQETAYPYFIEYLKIFLMFWIASIVMRSLAEVWILFVITALVLGYLAYEINHMYIFGGYLYIYKQGYGGLDNNGAGLMLAMGVPMCFFAWEAITKWYRWAFMAMIPLFIHAVLMSYSRGAMVSLIGSLPFFVIRSRRRFQLALVLVGISFLVPVMAGAEIRQRFFSISEHEIDDSANQRKTTWSIAWRMAKENPIFGLGIRNSNLFTFDYGADFTGRTIHSQYLQTAADSGLVALGLYLLVLVSVWFSTRRARVLVKGRTDPDARKAYAIACGVECALTVFCIGAIFLSLENFELPYILMLLGAQVPTVVAPQAPPRLFVPMIQRPQFQPAQRRPVPARHTFR